MDSEMDTFEQSSNYGSYIGNCKWFNSKIGYGFVTVVSDGDKKGRDIFVHHTGLKPKNSNFRTLSKGEYISLDVEDGANGLQGVNITGVLGGPLMCDNIIFRNNMHHSGRQSGGQQRGFQGDSDTSYVPNASHTQQTPTNMET
jgi:cold shock protein|tara:strand:+ start:1311 stop:1739 length:429 start_codon:yes stop_codon:yes gene_type:complete